MSERNCLAEQFEENRAHLRSVAYRMLGPVSEVDDAVQEAWLRLSRRHRDGAAGTIVQSGPVDDRERKDYAVEVIGDKARLGALELSVVD